MPLTSTLQGPLHRATQLSRKEALVGEAAEGGFLVRQDGSEDSEKSETSPRRTQREREAEGWTEKVL
jgi:hypothetical protein